jgi:hypothetical protein
MRMVLLGMITPMVMGILGCGRIDAQDVKQSAWYADYAITNKNGRTTCIASFRAGGENGSYIELDREKDDLYCLGKRMGKSNGLFNEVTYSTGIEVKPNQIVQIELRRESGAFLAEVQVPEATDIEGMEIQSSYQKGLPLAIVWKSIPQVESWASLTYNVDEKTHYYSTRQQQDIGLIRFEAHEVPQLSQAGDVPAQLNIYRVRSGKMPDELKGRVKFTTLQETSIKFTN